MKKLQVYIANLLTNDRQPIIFSLNLQGFFLHFIQKNTELKIRDHLNQFIITTEIIIEHLKEGDLDKALDLIDNVCLLLSFLTGSDVVRASYSFNNKSIMTPHVGARIKPEYRVIYLDKNSIKHFITTCFENFQNLKIRRQLHIVIGYLCEANGTFQAIETKLILHYVILENLKYTYAIDNQYLSYGSFFTHKNYPHLDTPPTNIEDYLPLNKNRKKYVHKIYGKVNSTDMTLKMFDEIGIKKELIQLILTKRHKIIHEGIILPLSDEDYDGQAIRDLYEVNDLLRRYLLIILGYKGSYRLNGDRIGMSGIIE